MPSVCANFTLISLTKHRLFTTGQKGWTVANTTTNNFVLTDCIESRSQWPGGLKPLYAVACLLGLRVRIPPGA